MDVLAQALNVAEQAEAAQGSVTVTFHLDDPAHRAAYAAALAVLRISGVDEDALIAGIDEPAAASIVDVHGDPMQDLRDEQDAQVLKTYTDVISELTADEARRGAVVRDTFPRVAALLRDGANVEAVAQIQYRRWVEENLDTVRRA